MVPSIAAGVWQGEVCVDMVGGKLVDPVPSEPHAAMSQEIWEESKDKGHSVTVSKLNGKDSVQIMFSTLGSTLGCSTHMLSVSFFFFRWGSSHGDDGFFICKIVIVWGVVLVSARRGKFFVRGRNHTDSASTRTKTLAFAEALICAMTF